jgi:uncharacterized membrane protein
MSRYDAYKFIHISAAIIWLGAGVMIQILGARAQRTRDDDYLRRLFHDAGRLGKTMFIPASLIVVVCGILMVVDGPWDFKPLWITLGLVGYATTFATGAFVLGPRSEKVSARLEQEGAMSAPIAVEMRRVLLFGRIDTVVLFLVVAVMVLKPTGDDGGVLAAMAAILVAGVALTVSAMRAAPPAEVPATVG